MLELVAATALLAITLVPGLRIIRDAMQVGRQSETRGLLATFCTNKLEDRMALASATWVNNTTVGNFSSEGYSQLRYSVVASDASVDGGIPNRLMAVIATTYEDTNSNSALDAGEPSMKYAGKVAKLVSYQNAAGS